MQYVVGLFTLPIECTISAGVGCVVGSVMNLIFYKDL